MPAIPTIEQADKWAIRFLMLSGLSYSDAKERSASFSINSDAAFMAVVSNAAKVPARSWFYDRARGV